MLEILALTLNELGGLFVAYAALRVHHRVLNEHRIDEEVVNIMKREQVVGVIGVFLIIIGYTLELGGLL